MSLYTVLMGSSESFRHSSQTQSPAPNYSRSFSCLFLECLISCSAIRRCSTLYTTINKFLYIHTQFLLIFVQNVYFRNSVPTKTWEQPSRKSVLNPPSEHQGSLWWNAFACTSRNSGPMLPSGRHPFVVTSGVRGAGCCQTHVHTQTPRVLHGRTSAWLIRSAACCTPRACLT